MVPIKANLLIAPCGIDDFVVDLGETVEDEFLDAAGVIVMHSEDLLNLMVLTFKISPIKDASIFEMWNDRRFWLSTDSGGGFTF